jgi:hypothetical protein
MSTHVQSKAALRREQAGIVALEDDRWVWGVIFTTVALTGLCVATLFSVAVGWWRRMTSLGAFPARNPHPVKVARSSQAPMPGDKGGQIGALSSGPACSCLGACNLWQADR